MLEGQRTLIYAYIAGIVAADGHIDHREVRISVSVKNVEYVSILLQLLRTLGYRPKASQGTRAMLIRIYSIDLKNILTKKYGVPEGRKAERLRLPNLSDKKEILAFIGGFFDGDGSISFIKSGVKQSRWGPYYTPRITFTSKSLNLLRDIKTVLEHEGLNNGLISFDSSVYRLRYYGRENLCSFMKKFDPYVLNPERRRPWGANSCREVSC